PGDTPCTHSGDDPAYPGGCRSCPVASPQDRPRTSSRASPRAPAGAERNRVTELVVRRRPGHRSRTLPVRSAATGTAVASAVLGLPAVYRRVPLPIAGFLHLDVDPVVGLRLEPRNQLLPADRQLGLHVLRCPLVGCLHDQAVYELSLLAHSPISVLIS